MKYSKKLMAQTCSLITNRDPKAKNKNMKNKQMIFFNKCPSTLGQLNIYWTLTSKSGIYVVNGCPSSSKEQAYDLQVCDTIILLSHGLLWFQESRLKCKPLYWEKSEHKPHVRWYYYINMKFIDFENCTMIMYKKMSMFLGNMG